MFEQFDDQARQVIILAQRAAKTLQHQYFGVEHLLLGLVDEGEGTAAKALLDLGVTRAEAWRRVERLVGRGRQRVTGYLPPTESAQHVLSSLSQQVDVPAEDIVVGTEHIILAIVNQEDEFTTAWLSFFNLTRHDVHEQVIARLRGEAGCS